MPKKGKPKKGVDLATAHHEAGHAVVSLCLNIGVKAVRLTPGDKGASGFARGTGSAAASMRWIATRRGGSWNPTSSSTSRGSSPEAEYLGQHPDTFTGHEGDDETAVDLALYACGSAEETHAFQVWLFERTRNLVRQCWPQIQAVAAALAKKGSLTGKQVRELMRDTLTG